jgi:hypothetical protein
LYSVAALSTSGLGAAAAALVVVGDPLAEVEVSLEDELSLEHPERSRPKAAMGAVQAR